MQDNTKPTAPSNEEPALEEIPESELRSLSSSVRASDVRYPAVGSGAESPSALAGTCISPEEYKRLYEESKRNEALYRSLLNSSPDAIVIYDMSGRVQYVNSSFTLVFGWIAAEVVGTRLDFVPESEMEVTMELIRCVVEQGKPCSHFETKRYTKDGRLLDFSLSASRYHDIDGRPAGTLVIFRDTTDRKRAEELLLQTERLTAIAELASGVAHNFNNLLQITMGVAGLALMRLSSGNPEKVQSYLERIIETARLGAETVRRLQDFALVRSQKTVGREELFDLSHAAEKAIQMAAVWWEASPEKAGIKITFKRGFNRGCWVMGHEHELFEVAINLIKNSAEALLEGGEVQVETAVEDGTVVLRVKDQGVGIPKEHLTKVFEPFWTTKGHRGTGMGLASTFGIVSRYQGNIVMDSQPGKGTTATVRLPLAHRVVREQAYWKELDGKTDLRMLAVDDIEPVLDLLQEGLSQFGHDVVTAKSGQEAVELFRLGPFDVVICDLAMPGMNGWQVASQVREICVDKGVPKTPFILLTGMGGQLEESARIDESGVDRILEKPVDIVKLMEVVKEAMAAPGGNDN